MQALIRSLYNVSDRYDHLSGLSLRRGSKTERLVQRMHELEHDLSNLPPDHTADDLWYAHGHAAAAVEAPDEVFLRLADTFVTGAEYHKRWSWNRKGNSTEERNKELAGGQR